MENKGKQTRIQKQKQQKQHHGPRISSSVDIDSIMARRGFEKEQAAIVNLEFVIQEHIAHLHNEPLASLQEINSQNHDAKALLKQLHACLRVPPPPKLPSVSRGQVVHLTPASDAEFGAGGGGPGQ
jgi:hypothetical protein